MQETASIQEFVSRLQDMRINKQSGTFYIKTDSGRSSILIMRQGMIADLRVGPTKGERAVEQMQQVRTLTFRLDGAGGAGRMPPEEDSNALFFALEAIAENQPADATDRAPATAKPAMPKNSPPPAAKPASSIKPAKMSSVIDPSAKPAAAKGNPKLLKVLSTELSRYLGPAAGFLAEDILERFNGKIGGPAELKSYINALAREIDDPAETAEFIQRASEAAKEHL